MNESIKDAITHFRHGIDYDIFSEPVTSYAKLAIEALEKQIPKKIKEIHCDEYYCPSCGSENMADQYVVHDKYCPKCGQKLDWSGEDEN